MKKTILQSRTLGFGRTYSRQASLSEVQLTVVGDTETTPVVARVQIWASVDGIAGVSLGEIVAIGIGTATYSDEIQRAYTGIQAELLEVSVGSTAILTVSELS